MSIPLDRLYHYLNDLSSGATVIYRWYPHGSKKLDDLGSLDDTIYTDDPFKQLFAINLVCHDQEPLDYNYYSFEDCLESTKMLASNRKKQNLPYAPWSDSEEFLYEFAKTHLRVKLNPALNLHDYVLLCHSEKNSPELALYEQNNFIGVYYWCHALIARDWFRYAEFDKQLTPNLSLVTKDFLIYNRAWSGTREYRLKFIELLVNAGLHSQCNVKFNPLDNNHHYTNHNFKNHKFAVSRWDFESIVEPNNAPSSASADYNSNDYQTSGIEVVLETLFDDCRQHLTEKVLRPIACGRPFILAATPGSLEYLRSYGFKTFHGLINEEYDTISDPLERLECITQEMNRIAMLDADQKSKLWKQLYDIAAYNKDRFFSSELHQQVIGEFVENVTQACEKSQKHVSGKWWNKALGLNRHVPPTEIVSKIDKWLADNN